MRNTYKTLSIGCDFCYESDIFIADESGYNEDFDFIIVEAGWHSFKGKNVCSECFNTGKYKKKK